MFWSTGLKNSYFHKNYLYYICFTPRRMQNPIKPDKIQRGSTINQNICNIYGTLARKKLWVTKWAADFSKAYLNILVLLPVLYHTYFCLHLSWNSRDFCMSRSWENDISCTHISQARKNRTLKCKIFIDGVGMFNSLLHLHSTLISWKFHSCCWGFFLLQVTVERPPQMFPRV